MCFGLTDSDKFLGLEHLQDSQTQMRLTFSFGRIVNRYDITAMVEYTEDNAIHNYIYLYIYMVIALIVDGQYT